MNGIDLSVFVKMAGDLAGPLRNAEDRIAASTERMKRNMTLSLKLAGAGAVATGIKVATDGIINKFTASYREVQRASGDLRSLGMEDMKTVIAEGQRLQSTYVGLTSDAFVRAAYDIKSGVSTLTDEGVASMTASALTVAKATRGMPESMTSLFATSYGIFKKQFSEMSDADWGDMFGAALSKSVQQFKTDGAKMQQAIESAGAGATNLGMQMTEQMTLLGMMQQQMQAGEAGTALRAFATNAARAHEAFASMQVDANRPVRVRILDENGQLREMPGILRDLKARYGETLDAFEAAEIKDAFGTDEAMKMINALYGQEAAVRANASALQDAARQGASFTESMAANVDNYDGAGWDLLAQKMDVVKQKIGAGLLPALDKLVPVFARMAEGLGNFISRNPELVAGLGAAIVGLSGIATVAAPVLFAFSSITGMMSAVRHGSLLLGVALRGTEGKAGLLARGVQVLGGAFGLLKTAVLGIGRVLMANPIGLAVTAIAGGAYLIYRNWEPIKSFFSGLWSGVKSFTMSAWEGIKSGLMNYTPHGLIIQHWDSISGWFTGLWGRVQSGVSSSWEGIKGTLAQYTPAATLTAAWEGVGATFSSIWQGVSTLTTVAWEGIKSGFMNYTPHGLVIQHWDQIGPYFGTLWDGVKSTFTMKFDEIKMLASGWATDFLGIGGDIVAGLTNGITAGVEGVVSTISDIGNRVVSTFKGILGIESPSKVFASFGGFLMDGLIGGIRAKIAAVRDAIEGVGSSVVGWFREKLGIASPSKVFAGLGGHLSEGLAVGIDRQSGLVIASMDDIRQNLAQPMIANAELGGMPQLARRAAGAAVVAAGVSSAPAYAMPDIAAASAQGGGKTVTVSFAPTYNIELGGGASADQEERLRLMLQEHSRAQQIELERLLND